MKPQRLRLGLAGLVAVTALATRCSGGEATPTATVASSVTTSQTAEVCGWYDVEGCVTVAAVFDDPIELDEALAAVEPWLPVAVYRTEPACVLASDAAPAIGDATHVWSPFAYVDAEQIRVRRTTAAGAPPISGFIIAEGFWNHFEAEWEAAQAPGVAFWATVVYFAEGEIDALSLRPNVAEVVSVPFYRTGPNPDPTYPGELYLDDHEIPGDVFDVPPPRECGLARP